MEFLQKNGRQPGSSPSKNKWNLVRLYDYLRGHAALPGPGKMECSEIFQTWKGHDFRTRKMILKILGTKMFNTKNFQTIQTKDLHAMKHRWQTTATRPSSSKGRQSSKPRQQKKNTSFRWIFGDSWHGFRTGKKKKTVEIFQHEIFPPFLKEMLMRGDFFDCLLSNLSHPFFHVDLGHPWGRSFTILWMSWKTQNTFHTRMPFWTTLHVRLAHGQLLILPCKCKPRF